MPDAAPHDRDLAIADAKTVLEAFGGNGSVLGGPRRTYGIAAMTVLDNLPTGTTLACPTEGERKSCEGGIKVFGIQMAGETISHTCDGRAGECRMQDGACTQGMASEGLPPGLRAYADFAWQRSPYQLGDGGDGGACGPSSIAAEAKTPKARSACAPSLWNPVDSAQFTAVSFQRTLPRPSCAPTVTSRFASALRVARTPTVQSAVLAPYWFGAPVMTFCPLRGRSPRS